MNRLLRRSFVAAVGIHLGLMVGGGWLAPRLTVAEPPSAQRTIDVTLDAPEKPVPPNPSLPVPSCERESTAIRVTAPIPNPSAPRPGVAAPPSPLAAAQIARAAPAVPAPATVPTPVAPARPEPGGALSLGTPSAHGELSGLPTGQTPAGWVPGADDGHGAGSGSGVGVGGPEPIPTPPPTPARTVPVDVPRPIPPPPKRVSVRVCATSHLRPNAYCPQVIPMEFTEGREPGGTCTVHKAPPPVVAAAPPAPHPVPPPARPDPPREIHQEEAPLVPPRLVHTVKPEYPRSAVEGENEGAVSLQVEVLADGTAGAVEVGRSSGNRVLDAAAVKAVKRWRWAPARRGNQAVTATVRCKVRFELEE